MYTYLRVYMCIDVYACLLMCVYMSMYSGVGGGCLHAGFAYIHVLCFMCACVGTCGFILVGICVFVYACVYVNSCAHTLVWCTSVHMHTQHVLTHVLFI